MKLLLIGAGTDRRRKVVLDGRYEFPVPPVTLDINKAVNPDVVHDLCEFPYPFADNEFDEIHAYDVMEHTGAQGDWRFFFRQFDELWRILKDGGTFHFHCPSAQSEWAFGDPGHTRVFPINWLVFLDRDRYERCVDTPMTDYRAFFNSNWKIVASYADDKVMAAIIKGVK